MEQSADSVPVSELFRLLGSNPEPRSDGEVSLLGLIGIRHINQGGLLLIIDGKIDVVHITALVKILQNANQLLIVRFFGEVSKVLVVRLRANLFPLLLGQLPINLQNPGGIGFHIHHLLHNSAGVAGQVKRLIDVLIGQLYHIQSQAHRQHNGSENHPAHEDGVEHASGQGMVLPLQFAHFSYAFIRHNNLSFTQWSECLQTR